MKHKIEEGLLDIFNVLEDPRSARNQKHMMGEILLATLCSTVYLVLDMSFGENQSRIRKEDAPQCMAIIRHIALNLLQYQKNPMKRQSIKQLRKIAGWSNDCLSSIIYSQSTIKLLCFFKLKERINRSP